MKRWYERRPDFYLAEQRIVQEKFPTLRYEKRNGAIFLSGTLRFDAKFVVDGARIVDSYSVEIEFPDDYRYPDSLPKVREVGGRKEEIARKRGIADIRDLHFNVGDRDSACLCKEGEEGKYVSQGSTTATFLHKLVIPFFCGLSAFERAGKWPQGEYSHGNIGIREYYAEKLGIDDLDLLIKFVGLLTKNDLVKGHQDCPCESSSKLRRCHPKVFKRLCELREYITSNQAEKDYQSLQEIKADRERILSYKEP